MEPDGAKILLSITHLDDAAVAVAEAAPALLALECADMRYCCSAFGSSMSLRLLSGCSLPGVSQRVCVVQQQQEQPTGV